MIYRGKVRGGVVEFDAGPIPPDGVIVRVDPILAGEPASAKSLSDTLLEFAGVVDDLPSDLAGNHDHISTVRRSDAADRDSNSL